MSVACGDRGCYRGEGGAIIVFVALALVILVGMIGLAVDLGHAYINKSQLQNIADACALAGASALDSSSAGIQEAENRATDASGNLANKYEFNTQPVAVPVESVTYSAALAGPYLDRASAQGVAATIRFVRVIVPDQPSGVSFARVIPGVPNVLNFGAQAVAGQEPLQQVCRGLDPFSPAQILPGQPGFDPDNPYGYTPGTIYSARLAPGSSGKNCADYGLPGSVTGNFGLSDPSGRSPSVPVFEDNILNGGTSNCVQISVSSLDAMTGGGGNAILRAIQERFDQDPDSNIYATYDDYRNSYATNNTVTNFRRVIRVAFNDGVIPHGSGLYNVIGFGCFFMPARPDAAPPSSAVCLMYVGQCDLSGQPTGNTNPSITKLVLFR